LAQSAGLFTLNSRPKHPGEIPAISKGSIGQIEFDRSAENVKTQIKPGRPQDILGRLETAANDNQLAWPLIPFPEGWYRA
jgi:hypothetical protein